MISAEVLSRRRLIQGSLAALLGTVVKLRGESQDACGHIVERMLQMDAWRTDTLKAYEAKGRYSLTSRANHCAEMEVHVAYEFPGRKSFQVLWEAGPSFVRSHVLRRLLEAEEDATCDGKRDQNRICPRNYTFRLLGTAQLDRPSYVIELTPRASNKYLFKGRMWVDTEDFAVARFEGCPAHSPSFWLHSIKTVQQYRKMGPFWLPCSNETETEARLFGPARLNIDYRDYRIQPAR
jgi:hypothetical protein